MLQHPFQCLAAARPPSATDTFLLAACGSKITSTSLGGDATLFEWTSGSSADEANATKSNDEERPAKKQKTEAKAPAASNVIKLTVSPDNHHAVAVTEDKIVRVLQIQADGTLLELSQRAMPKRPCAVQILPDNATILCGDKFGDVYSLPLLPKEKAEDPEATVGAEPDQAEKETQAFKPSASSTTVHTMRNRKALEAQLKQKNLTAKKKEPLAFEHELLLGHVSMLTDLVFAARETEGKQRGYIITADRDEHIRVSRGPPQSHIIEGYCLGHTEFVSKVSLVPGTDLLVSGGGDSWIGVWDWPSFELKAKIDILEPIKAVTSETKVENVAVSGIWIVPLRSPKSTTENAVVVCCEGIEGLLVCAAEDLLSGNARFQLLGGLGTPVLDITSLEETFIVSLDSRTEKLDRIQMLHLSRASNDGKGILQIGVDEGPKEAIKTLNGLTADVDNDKSLDGLLYGVVNLRKRGYQNGEADGDANENGPTHEEGENVE